LSVFHGGDLAGATQKFGSPASGWVDLSTGINPSPYPIPKLEMELWARLPDRHLLEELKSAAAFAYGVPDTELVIPVSGTQILLQILPRLFDRPYKVRIVGPTYKEHEHCWKQAGHDVVEVPDIFTAEKEGEIVIVVNPNNPTGDIYPPDYLLDLAQKQHEKGGLLIVDGAFMDCTPTKDISKYAGRDGLVILRSFGKFFGLAGLRLGFVLAGGQLGQRLKDGIGPWSVSGPALEIGRRALRDVEWIKSMRKSLVQSTQRLDTNLVDAGLNILGGTSLFRYCDHEDATGMFEHLARCGILVRAFEGQPNCLRFGLPGAEKEWEHLNKVLKTAW